MKPEEWLRYHTLRRWRDRLATVEQYLGPSGAEFKAMNERRQAERLARADEQLQRMRAE